MCLADMLLEQNHLRTAVQQLSISRVTRLQYIVCISAFPNQHSGFSCLKKMGIESPDRKLNTRGLVNAVSDPDNGCTFHMGVGYINK